MSVHTARIRVPAGQVFSGCRGTARRRTQLHTTCLPATRRRNFIATSQNPPAPTVLTANRLLPYPTLQIFDIIADIASYPTFLPYCRSSTVTSVSAPDEHYARRWPTTASLTVGFQDRISESFTSRVFCVPPVPHKGRAEVGFVEALSGPEAGDPVFAADEEDHLAHHFAERVRSDSQPEEAKAYNEDSPLAHLRTRWSVSGHPYKPGEGKKPQEENLEHIESKQITDVSLTIEFRFRSPLYEVLGKTVTGKVAEMMIDAFEGRVKSLLGDGVGQKR